MVSFVTRVLNTLTPPEGAGSPEVKSAAWGYCHEPEESARTLLLPVVVVVVVAAAFPFVSFPFES